MQSIDVVAITELLGVAAPLMERKLGLVPNSLVIPHGNANEEKPDVSQKTRDALAQLPAVQHDPGSAPNCVRKGCLYTRNVGALRSRRRIIVIH